MSCGLWWEGVTRWASSVGSGSGQQSQVLLNNGGIILPMSHLNFDPALIHSNTMQCCPMCRWGWLDHGGKWKRGKAWKAVPEFSTPVPLPHCSARYTFPKTEKGRNVQRKEASPLQKGMVENNILVLMWIIGMPDLNVNIPHICHGRHGRRPCKFFFGRCKLFQI